MISIVWRKVRALLYGRKLAQSVERNTKAANQLDALVREVLRQ